MFGVSVSVRVRVRVRFVSLLLTALTGLVFMSMMEMKMVGDGDVGRNNRQPERPGIPVSAVCSWT